VVIDGNENLPQCIPGLEFLQKADELGEAIVCEVVAASGRTMKDLIYLVNGHQHRVDVWLVGGSGDNRLPNLLDDLLRFNFKNTYGVVVGVAFADYEDPTHHRTQAAVKAITGNLVTQVVWNNFVATDGFLRAAKFAVHGELPKIILEKDKRMVSHTIHEALRYGRSILHELAIKSSRHSPERD
jgi:hypothetical protein